MNAIYDACEKAKVTVPKEVFNYFNGEDPHPDGVAVKIEQKWIYEDGLSRQVVNLDNIDKDIKQIEFQISN